jgi:hypothetical protein
MGLLKSAGNLYAGVTTGIANKITSSVGVKKTTTAQEMQNSFIGGALTKAGSLAIVGGSAVLGFQAVKSVGVASLIPKSTLGKTALVVGGVPAVAGIVANPKETIGAFYNFEKNLTSLAINPSVAGAKKVITDNPIISGALAGAGVLAIGSGVGGLISSAINTQATRENTKALSNIPSSSSLVPQETKGILAGETIQPTPPTTPELVSLSDVNKPKRKKKASKPRTQQINQKVSVYVNQNNKNYSAKRTTQNYLNAIPQYN